MVLLKLSKCKPESDNVHIIIAPLFFIVLHTHSPSDSQGFTLVLVLAMGWFGGKSETPDPTSRKDRQRCWESRDAYFACLDGANVVKPGDEGAACADVRKLYEKNCAKSWVRLCVCATLDLS